MAKMFLVVPIDPKDLSKGYKFALAKNDGVANQFVNKGERLATPVIYKEGNNLYIQSVPNATGYTIYQNIHEIASVSENTNNVAFNLESVPYPDQYGVIAVIAVDYTETYPSSHPAYLQELFPSKIVPTPTAEEVEVIGGIMYIDTTGTGATWNKITLSNDDATGTGEFPSDQHEINLDDIKDDNTGEDLPSGDYDITVQGEKEGEATSEEFNAGSYHKVTKIKVRIIQTSWKNASQFNIINDAEEQ